MLGPSGIDGLVVATGHHRNGILLTPLTVDAVSCCILTGVLHDAVKPFTPQRFSRRRSDPTVGASGGGLALEAR
jgi:glycine oxidase